MAFTVYDNLYYANKPASSTLGMKHIYAVGPDIWKHGYESTDPNYIKNTIVPYIKNSVIPNLKHVPSVLYVDVEENRPFKAGNNLNDAITNYSAILKAFQDGLPKTTVSLYSIAPVRNPEPWVNTDKWEAKNDAVAPILKYSDWSMPSLYTFTTNEQEWVKYAIANIQEAKQYGKPVVPFLWPQYAEGQGSATYKFIDAGFWKTQLETVYKYADGVVLYGMSGRKGTKFEFDASDPWWKVTANFIKTTAKGGTSNLDVNDISISATSTSKTSSSSTGTTSSSKVTAASKSHDIVMEAENMKLGGGYTVETKFSDVASGGKNIATYKSFLSTAEGKFTGKSGYYKVSLAGFDQSVGVSKVKVLINNKLADTVTYNDNKGGAAPSAKNHFEENLGKFYLKNGDEIELQSVRDGDEWSRVDYVAFDVWG